MAGAVSALRSDAYPITTRAVRLQLGRGSYSSIGKLLDKLGAKSDGKSEQSAEMPHELQMRLADCALNLWQSALDSATVSEAALRKQCEERIKAISNQLALEQDARKQAEHEVIAAQAELRSRRSREHFLQEKCQMLRVQLSVEHKLLERSERDRVLLMKQLGPLTGAASANSARRSASAASGTDRAGRTRS